MFTETELREALEHSAARADDLEVASPTPTRRWLLPLAAAATVAALAIGLVAVVGGRADDPPPVGSPEPSATVELVDRAVAGVDADYRFGAADDHARGGQHISRTLGSDPTDGVVDLTVVPGKVFGRDQLEEGQEVSIAGTTGWLAQRSSEDLDGDAASSGLQPKLQWSIAFRTPGGDWAFARVITLGENKDGTYDRFSLGEPAMITAAYDDLDIRWTRDTARQPLRFGTLPDDARLVNASYTRADGRVTKESLSFTRGKESFIVNWSVERNPVTSTSGCGVAGKQTQSPVVCFSAMRSVAGGTLSVVGGAKAVPNQDADKSPVAAAQKQLLDGITVATKQADYISFEQAVTP